MKYQMAVQIKVDEDPPVRMYKEFSKEQIHAGVMSIKETLALELEVMGEQLLAFLVEKGKL